MIYPNLTYAQRDGSMRAVQSEAHRSPAQAGAGAGAGAGVVHGWRCLPPSPRCSSPSNIPRRETTERTENDTKAAVISIGNIGLYFWQIYGSWQTSTPRFPGSAL